MNGEKRVVTVVAGDGVGPEVVGQAVIILKKAVSGSGCELQFNEALIGGAAIDETGDPLPAETLKLCKDADAVLLGAVGGPKWDNPMAEKRPEQGLLGLRKELGLYANLRPIKVNSALASVSVLKEHIVRNVDMVVVRELTGGLYFGKPSRVWETDGLWEAVDTLSYTEAEIDRIVRKAFEIASGRRQKVTSVDKQNVLSTSRLWRRVAAQVAGDFPNVKLENMLVDSCAMHMITRPASFDVIVTENTFGDILTDEASVLVGSMGMLPSASVGAGSKGVFEPIHGSAPDIAGQDTANPIGAILSGAMMLRYSFGLEAAAAAIESAVDRVLYQGYRTADIQQPGTKVVSTTEMGEIIAGELYAS